MRVNMLRLIAFLSDIFGKLAAWMFFAIGAMITYEVVARYVFLAPTIWAEEMSRFFQLWAVYLATAYVLKHKNLIRITLLVDRLGDRGRRWAEALTLAWVAIFSGIAIWYGMVIMIDSIVLGRVSSTMLGVPKWMAEASIPIGFTLLLLQCLAEGVHLWRGRAVDTGRIEKQL